MRFGRFPLEASEWATAAAREDELEPLIAAVPLGDVVPFVAFAPFAGFPPFVAFAPFAIFGLPATFLLRVALDAAALLASA